MLLLTFQNFPGFSQAPAWPPINRETKPWTRWWWHGSAVTKEGITAEMEAYQKAGFGGLEITPIYGVYGFENKFVDFLSPAWMELLMHTLKEAERLNIGIDMATGTGWPFGGPWVENSDACKNVRYKVYELKGGQTLPSTIEFIQVPYLRAVGNQIYEVHDNASAEGRKVMGTRKEPALRTDTKSIRIGDLKEPVASNKDLQVLALDQVQFEKPLPLQALIAYGDKGQIIHLTDKVERGKLNWTAPPGDWKIYAIFQGWHGKMVERAGPGGEGNVIDHFSAPALKNYLQRFDRAFENHDVGSLRAFFNDSYEVDDARGTADWTPLLLDEFIKRRGYDLRDHLPALFGQADEEKNQRVLCDYRETVSELLLTNFTEPWKGWAHGKNALVRNQAHGSPANILDLYATVDIPEIEGVEPLRIKMASSAGNVTGKKLISSESATWLNEHFESDLGDIKTAVDRFMLNGVNHIFYHGTSYSPPGEPWPGWLFYAAVHLNPRNSLWKDADALNAYIARCQSLLQNSKPDHDVLLYYPVYDRFSARGETMIEHFDGIGRQFTGTAFAAAAGEMLHKGFSFDYVSDLQIQHMLVEKGNLKTQGNAIYRTLVIPRCAYIPLATLTKIISLAEQGASIIFYRGFSASVSGFGDLENRKRAFSSSMEKLKLNNPDPEGVSENTIRGGKYLAGDSLQLLLTRAGVRRESMTGSGLAFDRKKIDDRSALYFISNTGAEIFKGWVTLEVKAGSVVIYDPMDAMVGRCKTRNPREKSIEAYLELTAGRSILLQTYEEIVDVKPYANFSPSARGIMLKGPWKIDFISGGPVLPSPCSKDSLSSWTTFGSKDYQDFSGTASYSFSFTKPNSSAGHWLLDLGEVKASAEIFLNGKQLGTLIGPVYQMRIESSLLQQNNTLEIQVSNLMANRIAAMDRQGIFWKKFYNINFPSRKPENRVNGLFDASQWPARASGLMGPVKLVPLTAE